MALRVQHNACPLIDLAASARKVIESEIDKHVEAIVDLKGRLNAMAPISKLPPELLSAVFTEVAIYHYSFRQLCFHSSALPYRWIALTHVCRSWRNIALNTPRFWSRIILARPDVTQEIFARSKKAPLWVTANISYVDEPQKALLDMIMNDSWRLKELRVSGPVRVLQNHTAKWTAGADILENLSLSDSNIFEPGGLLPQKLQPVVPVLFQGSTPNLRHLDIHHITVKWDNPLFCSTLTNLTVISRHDNTHRLGSFAQLLAALETMSALEYLELNEVVPHLPEDSTRLPASQHTVSLPNLRKLVLISDVLDCANLLNHVSLPANTRLVVTGRTEKGVKELVRVFSDHLARSKPLLTARLSPVYSAQVYVKGWRTVVDGERYMSESPTPIPDVELYLDAFPHSRSLQHLTQATFFSRVRRLEVHSSFTTWNWKELFSRTPDLRVLSISGQPEHGLLTALSKVQPEGAGAGEHQRGRMLSSKLHTVHMTAVRFGCTHSDHESEYLEEMLEWLMVRCDEGVPIATLTLRNCVNAAAEDVDRLREVVADVDWDGLEVFEDDEDEDEMMGDEDGYYDEDDFMPLFPIFNFPIPYEDQDDDWIIPFEW